VAFQPDGAVTVNRASLGLPPRAAGGLRYGDNWCRGKLERNVFPAVLVVALCFCLEQRAAAKSIPSQSTQSSVSIRREIRTRAQRVGFPYVCPWTPKARVHRRYRQQPRSKGRRRKITTIAGRERGFSGDADGSHGATRFTSGMAIDSAGNIYIYDVGNLRIRKVDANGIITTVACNGQSVHGDGGPAPGHVRTETNGSSW